MPSCLPGASLAVHLVSSCLPGASGFPIGPFLPPWCLLGCPLGLFLPPWCLRLSNWSFPASLVPPRTVQLVLSCLPGASQAVQFTLSCLPGASLVPRRLSNKSFPASLAPPRLSAWSFPASLVRPPLSNESFPASLADYWNQLVLPSQITGIIRSWKFRAEP